MSGARVMLIRTREARASRRTKTEIAMSRNAKPKLQIYCSPLNYVVWAMLLLK
jgi:hypothetical protein